jgi:hypothetical protein
VSDSLPIVVIRKLSKSMKIEFEYHKDLEAVKC